MDYNDELIGIIDEFHSNAETIATHHCTHSMKPNLIDFDDCKNQQIQSTATTPSSSSIMAYESVLAQNVRFRCQYNWHCHFIYAYQFFLTIVSIQLQSELLAENANLKLKIQTLERQKEELEEVNIVIIIQI